MRLGIGGFCVAGAVLALWSGGVLERVESDTVDARFALRGAQPHGDVVVVAIDDATFSRYQRTQWPYPRRWHAQVIDRVAASGARRIAYDVQFTERSDDRNDRALYDAVGRAGHVVLAATEVDDDGRSNVLGGPESLAAVSAQAGNTLLPSSAGGVIRHVPREVGGLLSFAWAAAGAHTGPEQALIDFQGPPGTIRTVSFADVREGRVSPELFRDKVVVVGASVPTLHDVHPTAASGAELMAGPEVQANAISTAMRDFPLRSAPWWAGALAVLLLSLAVPLAAGRIAVWRCATLAAGLLVAWAAIAYGAFAAGIVLPVAAPLAALALSTLAALGLRAAQEGRDRRRMRATLARFAGADVVRTLLDRRGGEARLGGVRQVSTVLFCDLRGFTAFAEAQPAERVVEVLNRYLKEVSDAILDRGGTLVSFLGDGVMAVFGSPLEQAGHAAAALDAARDIAGPRLERFNVWLAGESLGGPFRVGIGLNSGPVMSGMVGSERRLEYAAVGDTTNVAARLQALTKQRAESIVLSDATRGLLPEDAPSLVCTGLVELPGRQTGVVVWAVRDGGAAAAASFERPERSSPHVADPEPSVRPARTRPASGRRAG